MPRGCIKVCTHTGAFHITFMCMCIGASIPTFALALLDLHLHMHMHMHCIEGAGALKVQVQVHCRCIAGACALPCALALAFEVAWGMHVHLHLHLHLHLQGLPSDCLAWSRPRLTWPCMCTAWSSRSMSFAHGIPHPQPTPPYLATLPHPGPLLLLATSWPPSTTKY